MRTRDCKKQQALLEATISVVNEIGFAASSVSKIAKRAGVSPATLYIYYKNKEDLLVSTYIDIKEEIGEAMMEGFDNSLPLHDVLFRIWINMFSYVADNMDKFRYAEQFSNSPFTELVDMARVEALYGPLLLVLQKGIEQKIIKDVGMDFFAAFLFHPIMVLANPSHCKTFEPTQENIATGFRMAWDALRL